MRLFAVGFASCVLLIVAGFAFFYFYRVKPMMDRVGKSGLRAPVFPADRQAAVFEGTWTKSDGTKLSLTEVRGKVLVLNVWATWCGPCMAELPSLAKLAAHYASDDDVKVICVTKESVSLIAEKLKSKDAISIAYSTDGVQLPKVYSTKAIPATFLISKNGEIVFQHVGSADWASDEAIKFIEKLRKEKPNQTLLPTPMSVTDRAGARSAPATGAADL